MRVYLKVFEFADGVRVWEKKVTWVHGNSCKTHNKLPSYTSCIISRYTNTV